MKKGKKQNLKDQTKIPASSGWISRTHRKYLAGLLAILCLAFLLAMVAIDWGLTGLPGWQPDSIEGYQTVSHSKLLFGKWMHKYPRGHYLINYIFYLPYLEQWNTYSIPDKLWDTTVVPREVIVERLTKLAGISRRITLFMSIVVIALTALITTRLLGDYGAALLAALALALCNLFLFYTPTGCIDIPVVFWFAWSMLFGILAVQQGKWIYYILFGLSSAYCICTKEGAGGFVVGLWLGIWILLVKQNLSKGKTIKQSILQIFSLKVLAAIISALALGLVMEGFLAGPQELMDRMKYWTKTQQEFNRAYPGFWPLFCKAAVQMYSSWGWSLLIPALVGIIHFSRKFLWELLFLLLPLTVFYMLVFLKIHFISPRFVLCGFVAIAILIGKSVADFIRIKNIPRPVRVIVTMIVFIPALMCCMGMVWEMKYDTRVRAEQWVYDNIPKNIAVGSAMIMEYAPRIGFNGYIQIHEWSSQGVKTRNGTRMVWPEYLIAAGKDLEIVPGESREFRKKLFAGQTDYTRIAKFQCQYMPPQNWLWGYTLWPMTKHHRISPAIFIFQKKSSP
ncbi:MAG: glycosyltransferase family 39 protein [Sedimentisphaerales bacterium]|nr:glycosyltransferase family 39 protein [Sedimentisphaerales bacterium]